jgi:hypothetical protein
MRMCRDLAQLFVELNKLPVLHPASPSLGVTQIEWDER